MQLYNIRLANVRKLVSDPISLVGLLEKSGPGQAVTNGTNCNGPSFRVNKHPKSL